MRQLVDWGDAAKMLAAGGIVLMPTDTVPGLHCRADHQTAILRLIKLKGRDPAKPFLLLCSSLDEALSLTMAADPHILKVAQHCWPGPFTLIVPAGPDVPGAAMSEDRKVALRVPQPTELRQLAAAVGYPLISTSANAAGIPPATDMAEAEQRFAGLVDGVVTEIPFWLPVGERARASALVDVTSWPPRLLRAGPLPLPGGWGDS